jgi:hypothetical protein
MCRAILPTLYIFRLLIRVRGSVKECNISFLIPKLYKEFSVSEIYFTYTIRLDFDPLQSSNGWCCSSKDVREWKRVDWQTKRFRINQNNETGHRRTKERRYPYGFRGIFTCLSPWRPAFDPRQIHVGFMLTKWQRDGGFFKCFWFALLVSYYQCPIHVFWSFTILATETICFFW